jgi:hypothetical protein
MKPDAHVSLATLEAALTVIAVGCAFVWPKLGAKRFAAIESRWAALARRKRLSVVTVGLAALLLRVAMLPLVPVPHPFLQDDFSFLLAAETFASGHIANPTPAMWPFFETFHVTMTPTYTSMYFPAQGLVMAAAQWLTGNPWLGVLVAAALMCAGICWMLQAWLPAGWALLGGMLAVLRLGLFSYWINSYSGGASIAALGGALVLGAFPRWMRRLQLRDGLLLGTGMTLLALSRPSEGVLLCLPVALVLVRRLLFGVHRPPLLLLLRRTAPGVLIVAAGIAWMGFYNLRAFGDVRIPPYTLDRATYAVVPYYVWQPARPQPDYRHEEMRRFYVDVELPYFTALKTPMGFVSQSLIKVASVVFFYAGSVLLPPLMMLRRVWLDRRMRFLWVTLAIMLAGLLCEIFLLPHYLAPCTAAFYAVGLQAMRHLRVWRPGDEPVGLAMVRLLVTACVLLAGCRTLAQPLHLSLGSWPSIGWYGAEDRGLARAHVVSQLQRRQGGQLAIVRYAPGHDARVEWVYNAADIDGSKIVWAREMDAAHMQQLLRYYGDRTAWLVRPDDPVATVVAYPRSEQAAADKP